MRPWLALSALIVLAAAAPQTLRSASACAASVVLESLPYLAAGIVLTRAIGPRAQQLVAYLGCGCSGGPAARSLPAALATGLIFGFPVALARVLAAAALARIRPAHIHAHRDSLLAEIGTLVPAASIAGAIAAVVPAQTIASWPAPLAFAAGAVLGIAASPCALGGVALAASLHAHAFAAAGVLCTAGIVNVPLPRWTLRDDRGAYLLLALACALVAWQHGDALVHPRMTLPLACTASICLALATRARYASGAATMLALAIVAVAVTGAPAPHYTANETTLADAFAGEHVSFSGIAVTRDGRTALVRYAITCCRADAAPVSVLLDRTASNGQWFHGDGELRSCGAALCLHAGRLDPIAPPPDPFVYL